jgi:predicted nucleic acid-binding protein
VIVLDASVLIAVLTPEDEHHRAALAVFVRAVGTAQDFVVNSVTLAEALVFPARQGLLAQQSAAIAELGVVEVPFPAGAAQTLARLRVDTGLKLPDCLVLLTALDQRGTLATFDDRLRRAALDQGVPVQPRWPPPTAAATG